MKIWYNNKWIIVKSDDSRITELKITIGQGAYIDRGVAIGQGAYIDRGAAIGHGAVIGQDAVIGQGAYIETLVISHPGKYRITVCNGKLAIGCQLHTLAEWEADYKQIAANWDVSDEDREWYKSKVEQIKHLI